MAYISPLEQIQNIANKLKKNASGYVNQAANSAVVRLGQSPVGKGLVATQRFIESPRPVAVPQVNVYNQKSALGRTGNFVNNAAIQLASAPFATAANVGLDTGRIIGGAAFRGQLPTYTNLKTAPYRLAYNAKGQNNTSQQVIGNVAGTGADLLSMYLPQGASRLAGQAVNTATRKLLPTVANAVSGGARMGAAFGGLQGLSEGRNSTTGEQLKSGLIGAGGGAVGGAVLGGALGTLGYTTGSVVKALEKAFPKKSKDQVRILAEAVMRDEKGRYATSDYQSSIPKFYKPMENGKPSGLTNEEFVKARKTLGLSDKGVSQFAESSFDIPKKDNFTPLNSKGLPKQSLGKIKSPEGIPEISGNRQVTSSSKSLAQIENPSQPYFNVNRINVKPEVKQAIKQTVQDSKPEIEKIVGKPLSNQEVVNFANTSAKVLHGTVDRQQTLQWEAAMLHNRQMLAKAAEDGTLTPEYINNLLTIKSFQSDIARKLQSQSIGANPQEITAKQAILESILKQTDNVDDILAKAQGVDFNDPAQAAKFYRQYVKPNAEDWLTLVRYNSMLSSPNTHINNIASNFLNTGVIAPIEKTILGGVDFLRSKATGTERRYFAGEGKELAKGYWSSLGEAAHKFSDVMSGKSLSGNPDLRNLPLTQQGTLANKAEQTLNYPMRLLEGMDQFFQHLTTKGVEKSLNYRASKGVKVSNPQATAIKEAQKRLFRADIGEKGQGKLLEGMDEVTKVIMSLRNNKNVVVRNLSKFTLPFVKTPINILKQGVEYSPLGIANIPGTAKKQEALAKIVLGSSIGMGTAILTSSDRLTWGEPTDETKKNEFRAAGIQPYSVRIGDTWVSYSKLPPALAMNMALVAAVRDGMDNGKLEDSQGHKILNGLSNWWQFYADQSYVKNIGDMISAGRGDVEGNGRILTNYAQQLVPLRALMGWVTRIVDPYQRKADKDASFVTKQLQQFMTQIPGLSGRVPTRNDGQDQPIENKNRFINAVSPARITTQSPQQRMEYKDVQEIQQLNKQADFDRKQVQADALRYYQNLKNLPPDKANEYIQQTKKTDRQLYDAVKVEFQNDKYGLTFKERSIRALPVEDGTRVNYIVRELKKLRTPEEKQRLYQDWKDKKIISATVLKQLKDKMRRGEL